MTDSDITLENLPDFEAFVDDKTMQLMGQLASSKEVGQQRRLALAANARDRVTLIKLAQKSPAAFEEMAVMIEQFREHAKSVTEIAERAHARMCVAGVAALGAGQ